MSLNLLFIHKQVLADLPEMYDGKENKSSAADEKAQELIDRNKLYVSTYFNILSMMNQRVPQIAQLFRQLAPSYVVFERVSLLSFTYSEDPWVRARRARTSAKRKNITFSHILT